MDESAKQQIGDRLRVFRESKRLTQGQMAVELNAAPRGLQDNELGRSLPNSKLLIGLHGMGLNINWLLSGEGSMLREGDAHSRTSPDEVNMELLAQALAAVDKVATARGVKLSPRKLGKMAVLVYQYFLLDKAEDEATAYLSQLMELVSNN